MRHLVVAALSLLLCMSAYSQAKTLIFIGGLENNLNLKKQVDLFRLGYGTPKTILSFKWNSPSKPIISAIKSNPTALVIMFSAGCNKGKEVLLEKNISFKNIYFIEPYSPNESLSFVLEWVKFPPSNVFVGEQTQRGKGIIKNAQASGTKSHFDALTKVGYIIKNK